MTIISLAIIFTFTTFEFVDYRRINHDTSMVVDKSRGEKVTVNLNVTFPKIPCYLLSLDVVDISGERQNDITHNVLKTRIDQQRNKIADQQTSYGEFYSICACLVIIRRVFGLGLNPCYSFERPAQS